MSSQIPINPGDNITAPTPQNTPLNNAPISTGALSRPTVPAIQEEAEEDGSIGDVVLGMVQGKLAGLIGKSSGYIESLPIPTKKRIQALKGVMSKQTELQNAYKTECLQLEKKYLALTVPVYTRRSELINGEGSPPSTQEIDSGEVISKNDDDTYTPLSQLDPNNESKDKKDGEEELKGVPEFWLTALRNHPGISELITDRDAKALKSLNDLTLSYLPDQPGFVLTFHFTTSTNAFFTNSTLTKTYLYQPEVGYSGDFVYDKAVGCKIEWKEEKDLTREFEIKKQRNKNTNRTRLVRKSHPTESFFNFFDPPQPPASSAAAAGSSSTAAAKKQTPTEDKDKDGDEDEDDLEELEELEERLEMDYQIGEDLKEKIIPKAVDYFTGKALEWEMLDEDDSDWDDDEDDEDDEEEEDDDDEDVDDGDVHDDDDEDDEDDEEEHRAPRRQNTRRNRRIKGSRAVAGAGGNTVSAEECRNQ